MLNLPSRLRAKKNERKGKDKLGLNLKKKEEEERKQLNKINKNIKNLLTNQRRHDKNNPTFSKSRNLITH